jgi:hypothetical protein
MNSLDVPIHINKFITVSISMKLSFLVKSIIPNKESYTIPITGLFAYGATIYNGTAIISLTSAYVS